MDFNPLPLGSVIGAFLLAFPALFSIVNPIGAALIFNQVIAGRSRAESHKLAHKVAIYSLIVLLASLWLGGYVLNFFGISLAALRIAGGLVVAIRAWALLMQPAAHEERKVSAAAPAQDVEEEDIAFFPLTIPLTTGPGTIAVAVALSSQRPSSGIGTLPFFWGMSLAAACLAFSIWLSFRWSDRVVALLGPGGARVLSRLVAFLLLCVGVQIVVTGITGVADAIIRGTFRA
ncbi:MarC family protein [Sphingomonas sp. MMS24-J13]|uniref:MarC family protein n=1 Tax=Sphingomonas sp. MMS24-J13 TaxID=3238686 RepID=UPI00384DE08F